jgi:hypothetical protein
VRIRLKFILKEQVGKGWNGFKWLKIGTNYDFKKLIKFGASW